MWHSGSSSRQVGCSSFGACVLELLDSVTAAHGLRCLEVCGILVPQPGNEPVSPTLEGRFLTSVPPGKSFYFLKKKKYIYIYTHTHTHLYTYIYIYMYMYMYIWLHLVLVAACRIFSWGMQTLRCGV